MSIQVLIVDDEPLARDRLRHLVERLEGYRVVAEAGNAEQAGLEVAQHNPDIVLLDIQMPGDSGLEVAAALARRPIPPALIFCTAYSEHALDAFDVQASGYLLKPVRAEALASALARAARSNRLQLQQGTAPADTEPTHISARSHRGVELVPVNEVRCFVADNKYVAVHYPGGELLIDESLKELEKRYGDRFIRIHRNALVASAHVQRMSRQEGGGYAIELDQCGLQLPVSRRHLPQVRRLLKAQ